MENNKTTYNDLLIMYFELKEAKINTKLKNKLKLILIEKMESVLFDHFKESQHII